MGDGSALGDGRTTSGGGSGRWAMNDAAVGHRGGAIVRGVCAGAVVGSRGRAVGVDGRMVERRARVHEGAVDVREELRGRVGK